jgi:acetyl-CoA acetyltransferase
MPRAVILSAVRTPVGRYGGGLAEVRPDDLAATAIAAAVERSGVPAGEIEDVWLGCANQAGEDNRNVARMAALLAGLPESVAGVRSTGCAPRGCRPSSARATRSPPATATSSSRVVSSR